MTTRSATAGYPTPTAWYSWTRPACTAPPSAPGPSGASRTSRRPPRWRSSSSSTRTTSSWWVKAQGDISSVTTTSGLSWKIPGRVGDSPIIGAGQYCDNDVGAAGSTGRGESNIRVCGGFLTVEHMRRGMKPTDACLETLKRVVAATEGRLLDGRGGGG